MHQNRLVKKKNSPRQNKAEEKVKQPEGIKRQKSSADGMKDCCSGYRFSGLRGWEESQELNVFINWCYCQGPKWQNKLKRGADVSRCPLLLSCGRDLPRKQPEIRPLIKRIEERWVLKFKKTNLWCWSDKKSQQIEESSFLSAYLCRLFFISNYTMCSRSHWARTAIPLINSTITWETSESVYKVWTDNGLPSASPSYKAPLAIWSSHLSSYNRLI